MAQFKNWLRRLVRTDRSCSREKRRPKRAWLALETLEDRTMPSVVFQPQFGAEHATDQGGLKLNNVPVYLIFKGAYWTSAPTPGNPSADDITADTQAVLNGPYFNLLTQYGVDGKVHLAGTFVDGSNLRANFSSDDLQDVVENAQDHGIPESDDGPFEPLYVVVTPPGVASGDPGAASYNTLKTDVDVFDNDDIPLIWLGGIASNGLPRDASMLDIYTNNLSHEVAESITCIDGQGIVTPASDGFRTAFGSDATGTQIGDNEADQNTYRLSTGQLVQSLWSERDQVFVVADGTSQIFSVSAGVLTVNDDQVLSNVNDTIEVGLNSRNGATVTLNGETVQFDPGQISKIVIRCHTGNDEIAIDNTVAVPVEVFLGSGADTVTVGGASRSLAPLVNTLTVHGGSGAGALIVNDQGNPFSTTYTITNAVVFNSFSNTIRYDHMSQVVVNGGNNITDFVKVESTSTTTTFHAGGGLNVVNVSPTAHNLDGIGNLTIDGGNGGANVVVNDQANPGAPAGQRFFVSQATYTVTTSALTRDAISGVLVAGQSLPHRVSSIHYTHLHSLTLNTGLATNTDSIAGTPAPTTLNAGAADAISVGGAGSSLQPASNLTVDAHGGTLTLNDQATKDINTSTSQTTHAVAFTITDQTVSRVDHIHSQQVVTFPRYQVTTRDFTVSETYNYFNAQNLVINGGPVDTTFQVQATSAGTPVTLNAGKDGNQFRVGANGSVKSIHSALTLNGGGAQTAIALDDSQSLVRDLVTVTPTQVGAAAADQFFGSGGLLTYKGVGSLTLSLSNAPDDSVLLTPSALTEFFAHANAAEFQAGHGASLSLDLTDVSSPVDTLDTPGSGRWTFGNRRAVSYSGMATTEQR